MTQGQVTYAKCDYCDTEICVCGNCADKPTGFAIQVVRADPSYHPLSSAIDICEECLTSIAMPVIDPWRLDKYNAERNQEKEPSRVSDRHPTKRTIRPGQPLGPQPPGSGEQGAASTQPGVDHAHSGTGTESGE